MAPLSADMADVEHQQAQAPVDGPGEDDLHPGDVHAIPAFEPHSSFTALKDRIKQHYDLASDYYYSLW